METAEVPGVRRTTNRLTVTPHTGQNIAEPPLRSVPCPTRPAPAEDWHRETDPARASIARSSDAHLIGDA